MATPTSNSDEIEHEFAPFLRLYKSGRAERVRETPFLPAGFDPATSVVSKDVFVNPSDNVTARLYLPAANNISATATARQKLPILVYYHGGGFCIETAFSPTYHNYLNSLVAKAQVVVVSVHYRRLPEHPLPAAYDDSWAALKWISVTDDPWIRQFGDLGRVFLAGDSAGANIVHQMAVRIGSQGLPEKVRVKGIVLVHPYFWRDTGNKEIDEGMMWMWKLINPATKGLGEDPALNPFCEAGLGVGGCGKVIVSLAEVDFLSPIGREYAERVKQEGGEVEVWETEGENHVFHLMQPESDKAKAEMERMVALLNS